jgi:hypothetical protein
MALVIKQDISIVPKKISFSSKIQENFKKLPILNL